MVLSTRKTEVSSEISGALDGAEAIFRKIEYLRFSVHSMYHKSNLERKDTMKGQAIHITFHNPNTEKDSENLARDFISKAAVGVLNKMILDYHEKHINTINSESNSDLD